MTKSLRPDIIAAQKKVRKILHVPLETWVAEDEKGLVNSVTIPPGSFADALMALDQRGERPSPTALRSGIAILQRTATEYKRMEADYEASAVRSVEDHIPEMQAMRVINPKSQEDMRLLNSLPPELNQKIRDYWEDFDTGSVIIASMSTSFVLAPIKAEVMKYMEAHYKPAATDYHKAYEYAQANVKIQKQFAKCTAGIAMRMQKEVRELAEILGIDLRTNERRSET